jgi:hypothetical protein
MLQKREALMRDLAGVRVCTTTQQNRDGWGIARLERGDEGVVEPLLPLQPVQEPDRQSYERCQHQNRRSCTSLATHLSNSRLL